LVEDLWLFLYYKYKRSLLRGFRQESFENCIYWPPDILIQPTTPFEQLSRETINNFCKVWFKIQWVVSEEKMNNENNFIPEQSTTDKGRSQNLTLSIVLRWAVIWKQLFLSIKSNYKDIKIVFKIKLLFIQIIIKVICKQTIPRT